MTRRYVRGGAESRLDAYVDRRGGPDACWPWTGAVYRSGYGQMTVIVDGERRTLTAHRVAWEVANGCPVPDGLLVCHRCDFRRCCNPAHLFTGDYLANNRDAAMKDRAGKGIPPRVVTAVVRLRAAGRRVAQVAAELGISTASVRRIARGEQRPARHLRDVVSP